MGNRTYLTFGKTCQFDANNCVPIIWLSLFAPEEFSIELYDVENPNEGEISVYRTSKALALERLKNAIEHLETSPVWKFLRPLTILENELQTCAADESIELDITQFCMYGDIFDERAKKGASIFKNFVGAITNTSKDMTRLERLVNDFQLGEFTSFGEMDAEDKMFTLLGTYSGMGDKEEMYSLTYFNDSYWN